MFYWGIFPFVRLSLFLILGILLGEHLSLPYWVSFFGIALFLFLSAIFYLRKETSLRRQSLIGLFLMTSVLMLGMLISLTDKTESVKEEKVKSEKSDYLILISKELKPNDNSVRYQARVRSKRRGWTWIDCDQGVLVYIDRKEDPEFLPGDLILVKGIRIEIQGPMNPYEFDVKEFYLKKGITHRIFVEEGEFVSVELAIGYLFQRAAANARIWIEDRFSKVMDPKNLGVLMAMALGQKNGIDQETKDEFRRSGASHLMAVSGLHMGIIYLILSFLFRKPKGRLKWLRTAIVILIMSAYAFLSGLPPSALRACIMLSLIEIGSSLGRKHTNWNALGLSAFLLLIFDPNLIHDMGFQLSYSAMAGIFMFYGPLTNTYFSFIPVLGWVWRSLALTLSVLLTTSPVVLFYFGQFQVYGLVTNLFSGLIALIILSLFSTALMVSFISEKLFEFLCFFLNEVIEKFTIILNLFSGLPFADIQVLGFDFVVLAITLILVSTFAIYLKEKNPKMILCGQFLVIILVGYQTVLDFTKGRPNTIAIFPTSKGSILAVSDKEQAFIIPGNGRISQKTIDWSLNGYFKDQRISDLRVLSVPKKGSNTSYGLWNKRIIFLDNPDPSDLNVARIIHISCFPKKEKLHLLKEFSGTIVLERNFTGKPELVSFLNGAQIKYWDLAEGYILEYL